MFEIRARKRLPRKFEICASSSYAAQIRIIVDWIGWILPGLPGVSQEFKKYPHTHTYISTTQSFCFLHSSHKVLTERRRLRISFLPSFLFFFSEVLLRFEHESFFIFVLDVRFFETKKKEKKERKKLGIE